MSKRRFRRFISLLIALISLVVVYAQKNSDYPQRVLQEAQKSQPGLYEIIEFADGDTISVSMDGATERVRLIGVDTPETHDPRKAVQCFGQAAADFTKQLIGSQRVRLESDPDNTNRDRYSRLLRYVYLPDGRMVNREIIAGGYGFAYTHFPFSRSVEFKQLEQEARQANRGLWGSCSAEVDSSGAIRTNPV